MRCLLSESQPSIVDNQPILIHYPLLYKSPAINIELCLRSLQIIIAVSEGS